MKKIIIFLALFASPQLFAQSANQANRVDNGKVRNVENIGAPIKNSNKNIGMIKPENLAKLTPQEKALIEKNLARQKDFEISLKKLTPADKKKFQNINADFSANIIKYQEALNEEIFKISKIQNLITVYSFITKGTSDFGGDRSISNEQRNFYQQKITEYEKISPDKKKLIKQEFIKFRKNINALEKKRRKDFKALFKKDFENFKERESEVEIENDSKL